MTDEEKTLNLQTEFKALADESVERLNEELKDIKLSKPTDFKRYFIEQRTMLERIRDLENEARKYEKEINNQFLFMMFLSVMFFFFMMYVMLKIKGY